MQHFTSIISKKNLIVLCVAISALEILVLLSQVIPPEFLGGQVNFDRYVNDLMKTCAPMNDRISCYDRELPKLMRVLSMEDTFHVLRILQERDGSYWYCHVVSHKIAAEEVKKDPNNWKDVVARCQAGMCSNGCIHGAFMERFQQESLESGQLPLLEKELRGVCEKRNNWDPTGLDQFACYHALGHLLMYATNADTIKSVEMCKSLAPIMTNSCYDGVFMQIFQPLEEEDKELVRNVKPAAKDLFAFCKSFEREPQQSCWSEGWPLSFTRINDPQKVVSYCAKLSDEGQRDFCNGGMFSRMVSQFNLDNQAVLNFCLHVPVNLQGQCFGISASRIIDIDRRLVGRAVELCTMVPDSNIKNTCFNNTLSAIRFMFKPNTEEAAQACSMLPPMWKSQCIHAL